MSRVALVTGASRGIGKAIAARLSEGGVRVISPDRGELDLGDASAVQRWTHANRSLEIDVLVNNAGVNEPAALSRITLEQWQRTLAIDLTAPFLLLQAFAPAMAARRWGRVLNVGSLYSVVGRVDRAAYAAAKSGLLGLTRTAALELAPDGVLVNAILPGFVATELTYRNNDEARIRAMEASIPIGRLASVDEIAEVAAFLVSERNTYLTGQSIVVDGGFMAQ